MVYLLCGLQWVGGSWMGGFVGTTPSSTVVVGESLWWEGGWGVSLSLGPQTTVPSALLSWLGGVSGPVLGWG